MIAMNEIHAAFVVDTETGRYGAPALHLAHHVVARVEGLFPGCAGNVLQALGEAIATNALDVEDMKSKKIRQRYFKDKDYNTGEEKAQLKEIDLIFETAYVLLLSLRPEKSNLTWPDSEPLLLAYPKFKEQDDAELSQLLRFRNALKVAMEIFPVKDAGEQEIVMDKGRNKGRLFAIASRLEEGEIYSLGSGMSAAAERRTAIYYKEGGVFQEKRDPRDRTKKAQATRAVGSKPSVCRYSKKAATAVRLTSKMGAMSITPGEGHSCPPPCVGTNSAAWPVVEGSSCNTYSASGNSSATAMPVVVGVPCYSYRMSHGVDVPVSNFEKEYHGDSSFGEDFSQWVEALPTDFAGSQGAPDKVIGVSSAVATMAPSVPWQDTTSLAAHVTGLPPRGLGGELPKTLAHDAFWTQEVLADKSIALRAAACSWWSAMPTSVGFTNPAPAGFCMNQQGGDSTTSSCASMWVETSLGFFRGVAGAVHAGMFENSL
jgi:hypothetical protein